MDATFAKEGDIHRYTAVMKSILTDKRKQLWVNVLDKDYLQWVKELTTRYHQNQIKAAAKVNSVLIEFYWGIGKRIKLYPLSGRSKPVAPGRKI